MLEGKDDGSGPSMAMVSKPFSGSSHVVRDFEDAEKDKLRYSHCNGTRYTNETCFEIHGHPEWFLEQMKQNKGNTNNKHPSQAKIFEAGPGLAAIAASYDGPGVRSPVVEQRAIDAVFQGPLA